MNATLLCSLTEARADAGYSTFCEPHCTGSDRAGRRAAIRRGDSGGSAGGGIHRCVDDIEEACWEVWGCLGLLVATLQHTSHVCFTALSSLL